MAKVDFFGIDITSTNIKIANTNFSRNRFEVTTLSEISREGLNLFEFGSQENLHKSVELIKQLHKKSNIGTRNCVASISDELVFARMITLPAMDESEINESIHWAIKSLVPTQIEELNVSYVSIGEAFIKNDKKYVDWYVVAAPKEVINKYIELFKLADLNLMAIETEALAIARITYIVENILSDYITLDIGKAHTNLLIIRKGGVVFSQSLATGGEVMTKVIAADYGLSEEDAEKYKVTFGINPTLGDGKIAKSIEPVADIIVGELARLISYYSEKKLGNGITNIILTGGGSAMPGFADYINKNVSIPTKILAISNKFSLKNNKENNQSLLSYCTSIGLSIKDS